MESSCDAVVIDPATEVGVAESASSKRAASSAVASVTAALLAVESYLVARRLMERIWSSESRSRRGGDPSMTLKTSKESSWV